MSEDIIKHRHVVKPTTYVVRNTMRNMRENKLAEPVGKWLERQGYTVYQEVCPPFASGYFTDIVGNKERYIISIELKMSLTKQVIQQAYTKSIFSHEVYVAVASNPKESSIDKCKKHNVGVLQITSNTVTVLHHPQNNNPHDGYALKLIERLKLMNPGYDQAGLPSLAGTGPNKAVCDVVREYLIEHPNANWEELYDNVPNHYASKQSMQTSLRIRQGFTLNNR